VAPSEINPAEIDQDAKAYRDLIQHGRRYGTDFRWEAILPPNVHNKNPPVGETEKLLFERYSAIKLPKGSQDDIDSLPPEAKPFDRIVRREDGGQDYQYYRPIYATSGCVYCHRNAGARQPG